MGLGILVLISGNARDGGLLTEVWSNAPVFLPSPPLKAASLQWSHNNALSKLS